jgi:hypothetical protein
VADEPRYPGSYIALDGVTLPPLPERCALLVTFPGGAMGIFYGSRSECEATWERVQQEGPGATHEIKAMPEEPMAERYPGLPMSLPMRAAPADDAETFRLLDAHLAAIEPIVRGRSMVEPRTYSQQQQEVMDREVEPRPSRQPGWREKRRAAGAKRRGRR